MADAGEPRSGTALRSALVRFALLSGLAVVVLVLAAAWVSQLVAEDEAEREAATRAEGMALGVAAPFVDASLRDQDSEASHELGKVLRARISEGGVSHVVIWDVEGRILWTDMPGLVGEQHVLSEEARAALTSQTTVTQLPEDTSDQVALYEESDFLKVFVGARDRSGKPFLFEGYMPTQRIEEDQAAILPPLLVLTLGSLLLLLAAIAPLAVSLARRVDEAQRARSHALDLTVASWRHQRRLLAQELHDGVIQDLAAIRYGLKVLPADQGANETAAAVLGQIEASAESAERELRSLVVDLTPRRLGEGGLPQASQELIDRYRRFGLAIEVDIPETLDTREGTGILAYRTLREGLRNVARHTDARRVRVRLAEHGVRGLEVSLTDDGSRPPPPGAIRSGQGLRLLADTLRDLGGTLTLGPGPGGGAALVAVIPDTPAEPGRP